MYIPRVFIIWLAFFLSGIAGLSYEVTWSRFLADLFGSSTPAISATISIYFLGLTLGAWLGGRFFQCSRRPLAHYALLELTIGLSAALVPMLLSQLTAQLLAYPGTGGLGWSLLISTAVLIVPTTLLGATFPAMAAVVRQLQAERGTSSATGYFYGLNTLGAVLGSLLVAFIWLPALGRLWSCYLQVAVNITIALMMGLLYLQRRPKAASPCRRVESPEAESPERASTIPMPAAALVALASGVFAIAVEVLWVRALALSFPATAFVLALVLAAYLMGIGLGALAVGRLSSRLAVPPASLLTGIYLAVPLACAFTAQILPHLLPWSITMIISGWIQGWGAYLGWVAFVSTLVMLPATMAMGAALPLLIGAAVPDPHRATRASGVLYSLNTLGGVAGSLAATFIVMPRLGVSASLAICHAGYLALALLVALTAGARPRTRVLACALLAASVLALPAGLFPEVNPLKHQSGQKLLFYQDAASSTVSVYQDGAGHRSLWSNNLYSLSETGPRTVAMQYRLGILSTRLAGAPRRALLVGFATGSTLAAVARDERLKTIHCVELHELYFGLSGYFSKVNREVDRDPRVTLIQADGRHFLSRPGPKYDLVATDLFVPRNPGVANLYSLEHFRAVRQRLSTGGVFVAWLPLWQLSPAEVGTIIRTFQVVFPQAGAYIDRSDLGRPTFGLTGGAPGVLPVPSKGLAYRIQEVLPGALKAAFPRGGFAPPPTVKSEPILWLSPAQLTSWAGENPLNTREHLVIEHSSPGTIFSQRFNSRSLFQENLDFIKKLQAKNSTMRPPSNIN